MNQFSCWFTAGAGWFCCCSPFAKLLVSFFGQISTFVDTPIRWWWWLVQFINIKSDDLRRQVLWEVKAGLHNEAELTTTTLELHLLRKILLVNLYYHVLKHSDWLFKLIQPIKMLQNYHTVKLRWKLFIVYSNELFNLVQTLYLPRWLKFQAFGHWLWLSWWSGFFQQQQHRSAAEQI